jgi:hypothetical protein
VTADERAAPADLDQGSAEPLGQLKRDVGERAQPEERSSRERDPEDERERASELKRSDRAVERGTRYI